MGAALQSLCSQHPNTIFSVEKKCQRELSAANQAAVGWNKISDMRILTSGAGLVTWPTLMYITMLSNPMQCLVTSNHTLFHTSHWADQF